MTRREIVCDLTLPCTTPGHVKHLQLSIFPAAVEIATFWNSPHRQFLEHRALHLSHEQMDQLCDAWLAHRIASATPTQEEIA